MDKEESEVCFHLSFTMILFYTIFSRLSILLARNRFFWHEIFTEKMHLDIMSF